MSSAWALALLGAAMWLAIPVLVWAVEPHARRYVSTWCCVAMLFVLGACWLLVGITEIIDPTVPPAR